MKFVRTPVERKLLSILKELETDIKVVKKKNDALSQHNRMSLKTKVKIVQNQLNKFRRNRRPNATFTDGVYTLNEETIKYNRKINRMIIDIENSFIFDNTHYFIKMSKKDIKKGRLNEKVLMNIIKYLGDRTWHSVDFADTIEKIRNNESKGIAFTTSKQIKKGKLPDSSVYFSNINTAEYTDVLNDNVSFYESKKSICTISLKDFLKLL